jgi:hypothetical protein
MNAIDIRKQIAKTIIDQLGGALFIMMTGARGFLSLESGVRFTLDDNFAKNGINKVEIVLTTADLYDVTYYRVGRNAGGMLESTTVYCAEGLYFDQLQDSFIKQTSLYLSL